MAEPRQARAVDQRSPRRQRSCPERREGQPGCDPDSAAAARLSGTPGRLWADGVVSPGTCGRWRHRRLCW